jgi:hypothetical protein
LLAVSVGLFVEVIVLVVLSWPCVGFSVRFLVTWVVFFQPVGNLSAMSFIPLDSAAPNNGIQITYTGGSCLASGDEGSVIYKVNCSTTSLAPSVNYDWAGCHMTVTIGDPAGCGYSIPAPPLRTRTLPLSGGWVFVIFLIVLSVVYFGGGMAYKRLSLGSSGIESIPNIAFWRAFDANVRLGASWVVHTVTCRPMPNLMDAEEQYYHGIRGDDYEGMDDSGQPVKMLA